MARHAAHTSPRRALLRAGLTVTAAGAALGLGGAVAQAAPSPAAGADSAPAAGSDAVQGLAGAVTHTVGPVTSLKLDPLAGTGTDPLDNAVGTQIADFKPISTARLTAPVTSGGAIKDLPVAGAVTGLLTG